MILTGPPTLSKSRFLAGMQCHLRLWYQCYAPELASETSPAQEAVFQTGHEVGRLATRLYPAGRLIQEDHLHHEEAVQSTRAAMERDPGLQAIFEAAFVHDDVRVRVDILEPAKPGEWNLIEVKSSTSVKEPYLSDVAIQYHVLKGSGLDIGRAGILHVNNHYVYDGRQLDLGSLFTFADLKGQVVALQEEIPPLLEELKGMLAGKDPPRITPSRVCRTPHECEFWEYCTREMPSFWVLGLSGIRQERLDDLEAMGIQDIRHVPDSFPLSKLQERIRRCVTKEEECLLPGLETALRDVRYPVHFLDFETVSPAIPIYAWTRPYQAIPFQWSDHILTKDGVLTHREYLCKEDKDPREDFARELLAALGNGGTVFVYSNYEKVIITDLAQHLPEYRARLLGTLIRIKDLQALIKRYYYHPQFHGSFSLKDVIPALVPDMNYKSLVIQQGSQASFEYLRFLNHDTPAEEKRRIKEGLRAYCGHDTMAMLKIREELLKRC